MTTRSSETGSTGTSATPIKKVRLAYLVSHPIQYQAPLLRRIAQEPDIDLTVFFAADFSMQGYADKGFGVDVKWDVPLVAGYRHEFLPRLWKRSRKLKPLVYGLTTRLRGTQYKLPFDVLWVHGYSTINALHGILAAKSLGIRVLLRAESWLYPSKVPLPIRTKLKLAAKTLFFRTLKHLVDGVLPIGTLNASYWTHYLGNTIPQFPMPYAVDNSYFQRRSEEAQSGRKALQAELHLNPARPVILFAAKLQKRKCCLDLLEAYTELCADPTFHSKPYLVVVGDGEERTTLEQRAAASGLDGIRFCGFRNQSELPRFFDLAAVFVLPSRQEPWGLAVNEVMNAGRAVILSDEVGCHPDLVRHGIEGLIFPVGDVAALCSALRKILSDSRVAEAMGARARLRVQQWGFEQNVQGLRSAIARVTVGIGP